MPAWEITVIVLGTALVLVSGYLIVTLKKVNKLVEKVDALILTNTKSINSIVGNVDDITVDAKETVAKVTDVVNSATSGSKENKKDQSSVQASEGGGIYDGIKAVVTVAGFMYTAYKYLHERSQNKKINKIYKEMKRSK